ncbi:hypothetical protein CCAX7_34570 [Capsulimonas corticalis]|uniref:Uncharacterized protein n=1 Tax=Capsulimonas corticalis TaxID=2219043 RepID=A0A402CY96_9BACT|nr:Ig-like domain-containing protein [Capsulimonas corticalis]BDI31406.1 hypothetical protein CCAX7_34570 [Capsulimonas corticalis]
MIKQVRYALAAALALLTLIAIPAGAQDPVPPRETPRTFTPFAQVETHRLRIVNAVDGAIQVSQDAGSHWSLLGRVLVPAKTCIQGYLASGYAPLSSVAASAVHGLRIRVGDLSSAYPKLIAILPHEFMQTPDRFGGHVAGDSGIYTNIPVGQSIFRELSPYAGNEVFRQDEDGGLSPLPVNYAPQPDDVFVIVVKRPENPLTQVDFENTVGGAVTAAYADGAKQRVTSVLKPVYGVGRYDGCSYTGVGGINTSHMGVITVSTAPITTSKQFEGTGNERRGGFQIQPSYHNSQSPEAWAASVLILGSKAKQREPDLEGTPPLFFGNFDLAWLKNDPAHSWRAEIRVKNGPWRPMITVVGSQPRAFMSVTAVRLIRDKQADKAWLSARIDTQVKNYQQQALLLAKAGKTPIQRGSVTIDAPVSDPRVRFVAFYVDGAFRGITNTAPFNFSWDTRESPDGEYVVEERAQDEFNRALHTTRTRVWVDNQGEIKG